MTIPTAIAELSQAQRMLSEARTVGDFRDLRDFATSLRAWAGARGLGVESENEAALVIIRAERGAGIELLRMAEAKERSGRGWPKGVPHDESGRIPKGPAQWDQGVTLAEIGISRSDAWNWQALAFISDKAFEDLIAEARRPGPDGKLRRIAKMSFYRVAMAGRPPRAAAGGDLLTPFENLRASAEHMLDTGLSRLSVEDVTAVGKLGVRLVKAARSEIDGR